MFWLQLCKTKTRQSTMYAGHGLLVNLLSTFLVEGSDLEEFDQRSYKLRELFVVLSSILTQIGFLPCRSNLAKLCTLCYDVWRHGVRQRGQGQVVFDVVSETTKFEDLVSLPESPKHDHEIIECSLEWEAFPQALRSSVRTVERLVDAVGCGEGEAWDVLVDVKFLLGNYEWLVTHQQLRGFSNAAVRD